MMKIILTVRRYFDAEAVVVGEGVDQMWKNRVDGTEMNECMW